MTELSEHDHQATKINNLVDDVVAEYTRPEPSGRDAFWAAPRSSGWLARRLLDAGESSSNGLPESAPGVALYLPVDAAARWDHRDLLRD